MAEMTEKRFNELYRRAYEKNYTTFTDFLNLQEQIILNKSYLPHKSYGGYDMAERVVACFGEDAENADYPISCICIKPANAKFADKLAHRDFLGALMNLGIKRELLGDIVIENNCGYLFCLNSISDYIIQSLDRIRHTTVKAEIADTLPDTAVSVPESSEIIVSSLRLDVMISAVYNLSRREASQLIVQGKAFVNSCQTLNCSYNVKEGDIISLRGFGRFQFTEQLRSTKKDRLVVEMIIYK
ncbi:MAG: YlmH/Sll1252 family protein [Acetobacter sp.]|nr:YlmH/Sll1252 family protein [Bacteroides sp.]MCM1340317.1 YlmH/Sll1252 family protein [Acetobacter sp.]MCM1433036.1 YlmH/Sll1252 family protein [Clostridiales bacterium]